MSDSHAPLRRVSPAREEASDPAAEPLSSAPWLAVVSEKVKSMRYGVVQIVIHDSRVVQIERTERTRFDVPPAANQR